ncbi:MAG: methyltransferase [bacterium]
MKTSLIDRGSVERLLLLAGALRSGLIDALAVGGALAAGEAAQAAGTDLRASRIVLEALVGESVVERVVEPRPPGSAPDRGTRLPPAGGAGDGDDPGAAVRYRLTALGREHLVDEGPELERSGLLHQVNKLRGWLELPEVIRTGRPLPRDPAKRDMRSFVSAMGERDAAVLDEILERCLAYAGPIRTMLDVGGAVGHMARHFSRCGVRATLLDRENVIPVAREFLGGEGADIALVGGDYTQSLPAGPFDLVYLGNVYHIYGPVTNARVTREVFSILSAGGTIAIQDHVWGRSPRAALFAVNMLQATEEGGVWTEAQYREWLTGAGFGQVEALDLQTTASQLILGRRPRP